MGEDVERRVAEATRRPEMMLSRVSEAASEGWVTAGEVGRRVGVLGEVARLALHTLGASERPGGRTDQRGREVTEYTTRYVSPARVVELLVGSYWREVRSGERRGGHTVERVGGAGRGAWMEVDKRARWLRGADLSAIGLTARWERDGCVYLTMPREVPDDGDERVGVIELLDYLALGEWREVA